MNVIVKGVLMILAVAPFGACVAADNSWFRPYGGFEMRANSAHHANSSIALSRAMPQTYLGGGVFIGNKFHRNFSLEFGYDINRAVNKASNAVEGLVAFTDPDNRSGIPGDTTTFFGSGDYGRKVADIEGSHKFSIKSRLDGPYVDFVSYLPISDGFDLFGSVGLSELKIRVSGQKESFGSFKNIDVGVVAPLPLVARSTSPVSYAKRKAVARFGIGGQYALDNFGVRGVFRIVAAKGKFKYQGHNLLQNIYSFSLGFFVKL